jgi:hypothetical protein
VVVVGQDVAQSVDERAVVTAGAPLDLGLEDLGTALEHPSQQRQVFTFREAVVTPVANLVEVQIGEPLDERGVADLVDAPVARMTFVAHARDATPRRGRGRTLTAASQRSGCRPPRGG